MDQNQIIDNFDEKDEDLENVPQPTPRPTPQPTPAPAQPAGTETGDEKMEFLKREEIHTMQRDISRLRENEAIKERERIANINPGRGFQRMPEEQNVPEREANAEMVREEQPAAPPPEKMEEAPQRSSSLAKILIRISAVVVILLVAGFFYWFFAVRQEGTTPPEDTDTVATSTTEILVPPALITTDTMQPVGVADTATGTASALFENLVKPFAPSTFNRILLLKEGADAFMGLKEFFDAFQIQTPAGLVDKLDNGFNLFVYSNDKGANSLGFIAKINDPTGLADMLSAWEGTIGQDTANLFSVLGKTGPGTTSAFKQATRAGVTFRYVSFKPDNLGICWAISGDKFIFTSSGETMIKTIDKLAQ